MKLPTFFISHGGGPWPWLDERRLEYIKTSAWLMQLPSTLPAAPKAILSVSGHWEAERFTVSLAPKPPMIYDYYNFPPHTYSVKYPAPGSPGVAKRVSTLLRDAGITIDESPDRGFDHGTFVPLSVMYPNADVPVVSLSLRKNLNAAEHIRMGEALQPLREEGVLVIGSGLSYHNLRALMSSPTAGPVSEQFEAWLTAAVSDPSVESRAQKLSRWAEAPAARQAHPREDHLIPLMVAAGAAGPDLGRCIFRDHIWGVSMASYQFG